MERAEILNAASEIVCRVRENQYGSPENNFLAISKFWTTYLVSRGVLTDGVIEPKDVAAMMALLKIARIASGAPKADNWVDGCGYLACGGEIEQ